MVQPCFWIRVLEFRSFLWLYSIPLYVYQIFLSVYLSVDTGCFYLLALWINATLNLTCTYLFESLFWILLSVYPGMELRMYLVNYLRNSHTVSIVATPFYLPTRSAWEFQFLLILIFMFLLSIYLFYPNEYAGEGNGTPLQYSCLENPMDGGAW